ncbi:putative sulfate/molybdate transporter [Haloarchaeobius amylolyticus]|uniref:putative sulfate/molybdate transporter n=1 Tax=Haloarchaeobius amylolyticus TaxID=1198296 RepID=UPI00226E9FA7|nr:putative sulfate/molybdate transporter [Haloarchaeobius amylolyticus]
MGYEGVTLDGSRVDFAWHEVTGAIGDSVTVLPLVVAIAVLTDLSLALMLVWFGLAQAVWGLYYGAPISVEPMKALAALLLAGTVTTGEFLLAGLLLGGVLLVVGTTGTLDRLGQYIGAPVVRGVQFGVALVLLETGVGLGVGDPRLAAVAAALAVVPIALGYWNLSGMVVLLGGGVVAVASGATPALAMPSFDGLFAVASVGLTGATAEAMLAQLAMTVGNAALAASVLMADYFDRDVSADDLSTSMGVMNLVSVPLGGIPMCHGSGGIAGKYAFGARTAGANLVLGAGYVGLALVGVGFLAVYPVAMLGVVLALVALQLARTSLEQTGFYPLTIGIGVVGVAVDLGVAFLGGAVVYLAIERWG